MKRYILILLVFTGISLDAQTRRIAHRSHSGSDAKHYAHTRSSYGDMPDFHMVTIHLESGRDTTVYEWDTLANPRYLRYIDTTPRAMFYPRMGKQEDIRQMGGLTHKLIVKS